jgi:uncharacterized RDD family membrane protein YckC
MTNGAFPFPDEFLTGGVILRRCVAWFVDLILIGLLLWVLWLAMVVLGLVTLGLGFGLMGVLPIVPFLYHLLSLLRPVSATPGQQMMGLTVRRNDDLGPPTGLQAVIFTVVFYLTLAATGLLLIVALFTERRRTLHDMASGLVVVRTRAMEALTQPPGHWNMPGGPYGPSSVPPAGP